MGKLGHNDIGVGRLGKIAARVAGLPAMRRGPRGNFIAEYRGVSINLSPYRGFKGRESIQTWVPRILPPGQSPVGLVSPARAYEAQEEALRAAVDFVDANIGKLVRTAGLFDSTEERLQDMREYLGMAESSLDMMSDYPEDFDTDGVKEAKGEVQEALDVADDKKVAAEIDKVVDLLDKLYDDGLDEERSWSIAREQHEAALDRLSGRAKDIRTEIQRLQGGR